ncbi:protein TolR [Rubrivivax albus]|uniref:Protein TolR n=1 Tax=Rubrivivax albus TaxID=2499835 RepID=A0A3S2TL24_9BURK|nr:protein TolR [Rubrivivax albus]RVT49737.1 protein TolR [Rubrivivax albus]
MPGVATRGRGRRTINEINMVPFIDVMLVLLIIFMVTAPLITTGVVDLPSVGKAKQAEARVVEVNIRLDGQLSVRIRGDETDQDAQTTLSALAALVKQRQAGNQQVPVVITADRNVKYDAVVQVMDRLQRANVQRVGLSVQQGR